MIKSFNLPLRHISFDSQGKIFFYDKIYCNNNLKYDILSFRRRYDKDKKIYEYI